MQIASSTDKISSTSNRLVDLNEYMLINSVPYLKENNSPIPFNVINIDSTQNICQGKTLNPMLMNMVGVPATDSASTVISENYTNKSYSNNVIVDNKDSSIIYVITSNDIVSGSSYSSLKYATSKIYKLKIKEDKSITILDTLSIISGIENNVYYTTQDNEYIYTIVSAGEADYNSVSSSASAAATLLKSHNVAIFKINKEQFTTSQCRLDNMLYRGYGYYHYSSSSVRYLHINLYDAVPTVLYEVPNEGLVLYIKSYNSWTGDNYNSSGEKQRYNIHTYYYSFSENKLTTITPGTVVPVTSNGFNDTIAYPGTSYSSSTLNTAYSSPIYCPMTYPNHYLETDNELYQYIIEPNSLTSSYKMVAYRMCQSKEDLLNITFSDIELIFPEDNAYNITELPRPNLNKSGYTSTYNWYFTTTCLNYYGYSYESFTQNVNGIDYLHVCYKGDYSNPVSERGIYTFRINEEKTSATFISFYEALGGSFRDFMFLKEDRSRILVATATSYHILNFDPISESWISSYDSLQTVRSFLHTKEDKLYAILDDHRIICQDLNGAVMVDFEFEKPIYNYNNADITSYITIWAKNADEEYTATNIKLTLTGNVVWQANGLQTLETTTSAEGPINIPFIIKGHTSINVGVDAII